MTIKPKRFSFILLFSAMILAACSNLPTQIMDDYDVPMVLVPAGDNPPGAVANVSETSQSQATRLDAFYIDTYKVTNQRYAECVNAGGCTRPEITTSFEDPAFVDHPVIFVTLPMAQAYCAWRGVRLPTLAEWEKAAEEELETMIYFWGDKSPTCQVGARMPAPSGDNPGIQTGTEAVGNYAPNNFGLYDMTTGVWEWVQDRFGASGDPTTASYGDYGQVRGIAWDSVVSFLRIARHSGYGPVYMRYFCGFRCARSP